MENKKNMSASAAHSKRAASFVAVIFPRGCLVVQSNNGNPKNRKWMLPGGLIDRGETPEQAAVRELQEESGLRLRVSLQPILQSATAPLFYIERGYDMTDKSFDNRKQVDSRGRYAPETADWGYAVHTADGMWHVLSHDGLTVVTTRNFRRGTVTHLNLIKDKMPPLARTWFHNLHTTQRAEWKNELAARNWPMYTQYAMTVLEQINHQQETMYKDHGVPPSAVLSGTTFYTDCTPYVDEWKNKGMWDIAHIDTYRHMLDSLRPYAHTMAFDVTGYRVDSDPTLTPDRDAVPFALLRGAFNGESFLHTAKIGVTLFPIFLWDRAGANYNESEVVAFGVHIQGQRTKGYTLTPIDMSKLTCSFIDICR